MGFFFLNVKNLCFFTYLYPGVCWWNFDALFIFFLPFSMGDLALDLVWWLWVFVFFFLGAGIDLFICFVV